MIEPTVHLVDDDATFLQALSRLLQANGFRVENHSSAMAFLGHSRRDGPGCVIAELRMPEIAASKVLRARRSSVRNPGSRTPHPWTMPPRPLRSGP